MPFTATQKVQWHTVNIVTTVAHDETVATVSLVRTVSAVPVAVTAITIPNALTAIALKLVDGTRNT